MCIQKKKNPKKEKKEKNELILEFISGVSCDNRERLMLVHIIFIEGLWMHYMYIAAQVYVMLKVFYKWQECLLGGLAGNSRVSMDFSLNYYILHINFITELLIYSSTFIDDSLEFGTRIQILFLSAVKKSHLFSFEFVCTEVCV